MRADRLGASDVPVYTGRAMDADAAGGLQPAALSCLPHVSPFLSSGSFRGHTSPLSGDVAWPRVVPFCVLHTKFIYFILLTCRTL